jgi:hypothetical protein
VIRRAVAGACLALGACRGVLPATEIVVTLDTTFGVPCTIDELHIEAAGDGDSVAQDIPVAAADLPGSITLVPRGSPRDVMVTVTGLRAGEAFATAQGSASFEHESSLEMRFVLDRSCVPGPCPAVGVGGYTGLPAPQPRPGCGEHGYSWKYAAFVMRDACAMREASMGSVIPDVDEDEKPSPLSPAMPFPFWFYGGPAGVCFALSGEFPDRMLWITWKEACFGSLDGTPCGPADRGSLTFGIALEETSNRIYVGYRTMTATGGNADRAKGNTATIGVTNAAPRGCKATLCSADGVCQDGTPCGYTQFSSFTAQVPLPAVEFDPR